MAPGDKDFRLLLSIMKYLGEHRDIYPNYVDTGDLLDLIPVERRSIDVEENLALLTGYLTFLKERGYVSLGTPVFMKRAIWLTAAGEILVQPELAQIDNPNIMSQVLDAIEKKVLTYPDTETRAGFLFNLREAASKNAPDFFAKLLVEVLPKLAGGG